MNKTTQLREPSLAMTIILAGAVAIGDIAVAQDEEPLEEVTVTATRLKQSGYEAPTPVTVLGSEDLAARGTVNVADIVNEIPAFTGSLTPSSTVLNSRQNGTNGLDLRGLGNNRNLVLVNGRRHVPFDEFGIVNVNAIPALAVERIEVVTGGASAAWGSDAVSGVVNIIYDKNLDGLKLEAQYGASAEGDAQSNRLSMAFGSDFDSGRGHFLAAFEHTDNRGIEGSTSRDWARRRPGLLANPDDTGPNDGIPQFMIRNDTALFLGSPNGVTLPLGLPTDNLEFLPDGTAVARELGIVGGNLMVGGSGSFLADRTDLLIPLERQSLITAFDYKITENVNLFFEGNTSRSDSSGALVDAFSFGDVALTPDNPYLPADVAALGAPVILFRTFEEFDATHSASKNENIRAVTGLEGEFGDGWTWDAYYQYGRGDFSNRQPDNWLIGNLVLAADAVVDPGTGDIVCRANLGGANGAPGCVPINLLGKGSPSAEAIDYITGTSISDTVLKQQVFAATIGGELATGWAGPILTAFGVERREESLSREVDDLSDRAEFRIVNAQPLEGDFDVTEVFGEVGLPLVENRLDLNAAARWTDYSTTGSVVSWKGGLTFSPTDWLRFRGTVSEDIRAPSIGEIFLETLLLFDDITNPFTGNEDFIEVLNTGNDALKEESGITTTFGVIWSPLDGALQLSLDWYNIDLEDTISQISNQSIIDRCFGGNQELCGLINFAPDNTITQVTNVLLNLGTFEVEGIDVAAQYSRSIASGELGVNLLGSFVSKKLVAPQGSDAIDYAGEVGPNSGFALPDLKLRLGVSYDTDRWGLYGQLRYINDGEYDITWGPEQLAPAENDIDAAYYFDLSGNYRLDIGGDNEIEVYGGISNAFDEDPPATPLDFISNTATNAAIYDVVGRAYYAGVRVAF